jgi:hypothetical protein
MTTSAWKSTAEGYPDDSEEVIVCFVRARRIAGEVSYQVTTAWHVSRYQVEASSDWYDDSDAEYNEEEDTYYLPEGWYQSIQSIDIFHSLTAEVVYWRHLPMAPHQTYMSAL